MALTSRRPAPSAPAGPAKKPLGRSAQQTVKETASPKWARKRTGKEPVKPLNLTLPTELSVPINSIEQASFCIYGERKIGKSSLASMFKRAMFLMCEPGGKGLELHERKPANWVEFVGYVDLLVEDKRKTFQTVVIDVVDKAHKMCQKEVCRREDMRHPNDKPYGEGWTLVRTEFEEQIERLHDAGYGIVFLSHADDKEFTTRSGRRYMKIVPTMPKQAAAFVLGWVDVIAFYGYYGEDRYLTVRGSEELEAGCRLKRNFRTKSGRRVHSVPMFDERNPDFDEEDSYKRLVAAFNNQQVKTGEPEDSATLSNKPAIRRKGER